MSSMSSKAARPDRFAADQAVRPAGIRLKLFVGRATVGLGQINLLQQIGNTGSLTLAAAAMAMPEDRASSLLKLMSDGFAAPLVRSVGSTDDELELTKLGAELISRYYEQDRQIQAQSSDLKAWLTDHQAV